ncbi:PAS domain S-box protein [Leptolyngbya sp. FACHB-16]|uniref:hybrid sensor histidine kinase/response regulator n=1 Tax=unclassified Leptolyngbya TaxID=2650499 RepID=UPI001687A8AC|nr:PAS domain S-box protein [Leptolyngbya sp. FACHB-16]MBD2156585.1 PAS domain S-box protein [Leptolyngbya sp. FACHB-16]
MTEENTAISNQFPPPENIEIAPLVKNEAQFQLFLEASPDGFIILRSIQDSDGQIADFTIEYINPAAANGIDCAREELIDQRLLQLLPDCKTNGVFGRYVTVAETGDSQTFETLHEGKGLTGWFRHVVVRLNGSIAVSFSDITERKHTEDERKQVELALRQQEQHFRIALQTAKLGSWENNLVTGIFTCSEQHKANFGLPSDAEFTYETLFSALHPEDRSTVKAAIERCIEERVDYAVEKRCYHPDGSLHWLIARGQLVYDSQGIPIRLVGVTLDITEQKQTEIALRESQELFQSFMDYSPIAAFIKDEAGHYLYANSWVERVYGRPQSELLGKTDFELLPSAVAQQFYENDKAVLSSGQPMQMLESIYHEDGEHSYLSFKFPFLKASGQQVLAGVALDISQRIQTETALQQREAELRLVTNAVPALISFIDTEQRYRFSNQQHEEWFGISIAEINGKYLWEVLDHSEYTTIHPYVEQVLAGQAVAFEGQIVHKEKGVRDALFYYVPRFGPQGDIEGFVALVSDFTHRKQAEETLQQSEERLRIAQQAANAGVWDWDITTNQVTWSEEYYRLYGLDPSVIQSSYENWLGSVVESDREECDRAARTALEQQSDLNVEFRILHPTQGERWLTAIGQTLLDEDGNPKRMTGIALDITHRKQAEKTLQRYQLLSEHSRDIVLFIDKDGRIIEANQAAERAYGYSRIQLLSLKLSDLRAPNTLPVLPQQFEQALQNGILFETIHQGRNGHQFPVEVSAQSAIIDGEPVVLSIIRDITERKQTETALLEQEQRYRYIFEAMNVSIWEEDFSEVKAAIDQLKTAEVQDFRQYFTEHPEFVQQAIEMVRIRDVNQASLKLFGAQTKTQLLNSLNQIFTPETYSAFIEELLAIALGETHFATETVLQTLQGQRLYIWFSITFPSPSESYDRVIVSLLDITPRKQAEIEREELLAREQVNNETLQRFIEHTPVAVVMLDREMRYLFASQRWMQEYAPGYTGLKGLSHYEVMSDIPEHWRQVHQRCLAGATERCKEDYYRRSDGSAFWLHWEVLPWYASHNEIGGIIIFAENITEQKRAAQERENLLRREQEARSEAEQANRMKDEFLAVLSHELRSPLNPILGWSKLLQSSSLDPAKTQQALKTIERNAQLQAELIEDLLDVSRILQGKLNLNVSSINLPSIIKAAVETVRLAVETKSISLEVSLASDLPLVQGDPTRLQQVIWNLLSNAVKFTPVGGQVNIRLEYLDSYAQIMVSDTGQGIEPHFLPYVFDYFRQADSKTTRKFGGLGLGLAIVRYLVELHGGTVGVESPGLGLGATFTVGLPLMPSQVITHQNRPLSEPLSDLSGIQVLVVDDEPDSREFIAFVLEQAGARVLTAAIADEALAMIPRIKPAVLLSDIGMPGMDGYMLMQQVRALPPEQGGQIPAIALTAYAGEINQQQALAAGFQQHIAKPIEPERLVSVIASLVAR